MIYHAFVFWGLIRPDGDFNCLHDMVNDLFTDLSIDITHYGGESKNIIAMVIEHIKESSKNC